MICYRRGLEMVKKRTRGYLLQDIGLVLFLACILVGVITLQNVAVEEYIESLVMFLGLFLAILFAGFKLTSFAVVFAGLEILIYSAYRLFLFFSYNQTIPYICIVWLVLPILSVFAMYLFVSESRNTEMENEILKEQVEELVMIDSLTGLYNLRSLYYDLQGQIAYAERNNMSISLVIIRLRYEEELKKVLSRSRYEAVIQKLAEVISGIVRLEDKTYSIDKKSGFAIMLTCDKEGSKLVMQRILNKVNEKTTFEGIAKTAIKVEVRMACLQYDREEFGDDVVAYKQKVESELQYDV